MNDLEKSALERVQRSESADELRKIAKNAKGKSSAVERAALRRLALIQATEREDPVAQECWTMIFAVEEVRRQLRGRKSPMNRLRPKIMREGERAALEYLALHESEGFSEVLDYGMPEFSAEAIVVRHGVPTFSADAVAMAKARLRGHGFDPDELAAKQLS